MCIRDSTYTYQVTVQYEYKILNVTLLNRGVDYVARNTGLTDDQLQRYEVALELSLIHICGSKMF